MNLLTYTEFLTLCGEHAELRGVSYDELVKALGLARRTLYNERSLSGWRVKKQIGSTSYFEPRDVYEWLVNYTKQRQRKQAA